MSARTIRLYGEMGARFGRTHRFHLDSDTPAEAVQALMSQVPGMRQYLLTAKDRGVGFTVFAGRQNLGEKDLSMPAAANDDDIRIAPVLMGSKRGGVLQVIVGVVLVVAAAILSFTPYAAASPYLYSAGIAMIAGGVVQLLTPVPKGLHAKDSPGNTPSYSFNGPVNTQAQGNPVPLLYGGPLKVGSAVISAGIDTNDTSYTQGGLGSGHMGGGGGCVAVESYMQDGRQAGWVEVGDAIELATPRDLEVQEGQVTYAVCVTQPCVRIRTGRGVTLVCSISAPIPVMGGELVLAPDLEGRLVPVRIDDRVGYDRVVRVEHVGERAVRHISVNDGCFWAGEQPHALILHHNKQAALTIQDGR